MEGKSRIEDFLGTAPVEVAAGGAPQGAWWKWKFLAVFACLGLAFQLWGAPAFGSAADIPLSGDAYKTQLSGFQSRINAAGFPGRTTVVLDRGRAAESASYIVKTLGDALNARGDRLRNFGIVLEIKANTGGTFGCAYQEKNNPESRLFDLGIILPNPQDATARQKAASYADVDESRPLRGDFALSTEAFSTFTLHHEGLGHETEGADLMGPGVDCFSPYTLHLCELRADIAGVIGLARRDGNTKNARIIGHLRDLGAFNEDNAKYNTGAGIMAVCDALDETLANPEAARDFLTSSPQRMLEMVNSFFDGLKPSPKEYDFQNKVLEAAAKSGEAPASLADIRPDAHLSAAVLTLLMRVDRAERNLLAPQTEEGRPQSHLSAWAKNRPAAPTPNPAFRMP